MSKTISKFKNFDQVNISGSVRFIFLLNFHFGYGNRDIESCLFALGYNKHGYSSGNFLRNSLYGGIIVVNTIQYAGIRYWDTIKTLSDVYNHYVYITDESESRNSGIFFDPNGYFGISLIDIVGGMLALSGTKIMLSKETMHFSDIDQISTKFIGRIFQTSDNGFVLNQDSVFSELLCNSDMYHACTNIYKYRNREKNPFFICKAKYADVILEFKCVMYTLIFCYIANANRIYGLEFEFIAEESIDKYEKAQLLATESFENALTKKKTLEFYQVNYEEILNDVAEKVKAIALEARAHKIEDVLEFDPNLDRILLIQLALIKHSFVQDLFEIANSLEHLAKVNFCILSVPDFVIDAMNATKLILKKT